MSGAMSSAIATFVCGPVATIEISPGFARTVSMMKSTACLSIALRTGVGAGGLNFFSRLPNRSFNCFSK